MSNTVAVVSVVSGAIVGLAGIVVTGVGGWRDRIGQQRLARTARRADAYIDLLELAGHIGQWIATIHPILSSAGDPPPHPLPSPDEQARTFAKVSATASKSVRARFTTWREAVDAVVRQDQLIRLREEARSRRLPGEPPDEYMDVAGALMEMQKLKPVATQAHDAMRDEISAELDLT